MKIINEKKQADPLSEAAYLEQLEKLYPNCPFPPVLMTLSSLNARIGDVVREASRKGFSDIDAFAVVELLKGRSPLAQPNGQPTALLTAFGAAIGRDPLDLLQLAATKATNRFEDKKESTVPNRGLFAKEFGAGLLPAVKSILSEQDKDGLHSGDETSFEIQRAAWHLAQHHVTYRGARRPRASIHRPRRDSRDNLG